MHIAIVGAGAAGCFAAIQIARQCPEATVSVFERLSRPLAKVAVTGGGRCNLTNSFADVRSLESVYPRGARLMKRLFKVFDHRAAMRWFEREGVPLVTQEDQCVFPRSQRADDIVQTLLRLMRRHGVHLHTGCGVTAIHPLSPGYRIDFQEKKSVEADIVVVTTGGSPRESRLNFLSPLALEKVSPVPSLFSFVLENHPLAEHAGIVVPNVTTRLAGTRFKAEGPLLVTHWGVSGPAILRLSSYAARHLCDNAYRAELVVGWLGEENEASAAEMLQRLSADHEAKQVGSVSPEPLSRRLWHTLLRHAGISHERRWSSLSAKDHRRLASRLTGHTLTISGRNPHKEEFVTCGGIALDQVHPSTLECRRHSGLYLAGEVLDVDAVTGGFNLQAAWTMGFVVAQSIGLKEDNPFVTDGR
ncbi:MAG: aminoacetone oxidase family FAD-binding enzyme [Alloprevotella sp.]